VLRRVKISNASGVGRPRQRTIENNPGFQAWVNDEYEKGEPGLGGREIWVRWLGTALDLVGSSPVKPQGGNRRIEGLTPISVRLIPLRPASAVE
jgi:hypothetical protein